MIKLEHGDCLELMKSIPDKSIDFILADPPYAKTKAKWDQQIPLDKVWKEYKRIIKDHGCIALFGMGLFSDKNELIGNKYVKYRYEWIWHKAPRLPFMAHKRPLFAVEKISVFYKHLPVYNPQMIHGKPYSRGISYNQGVENPKENANKIFGLKPYKKRIHNNGLRFPINIVYFSGATNQYHKSYHPTQKPTNLLRYLIKTYTDKNDLVLDNVMGSGSTGVAAKQLHRNFIGMEINNHYFNVAKKRINKVSSKKLVSE